MKLKNLLTALALVSINDDSKLRAFLGPNGWYVAAENASGIRDPYHPIMSHPENDGRHVTAAKALAACGVHKKSS
jgi:hypothetical protein